MTIVDKLSESSNPTACQNLPCSSLAPGSGDMDSGSASWGAVSSLNDVPKHKLSLGPVPGAAVYSNSLLPEKNKLVPQTDQCSGDGISPPQKILFPSEKICLKWQQIHRVGAGLQNLGNTCFVNSALQCLTYTPPLANYMLSHEHTNICHEQGFCMMCTMQAHVTQALANSGSVIKPMAVINDLRRIAKHFRFGNQEDAHEFIRYTIDAMQKACLDGSSKLDRHTQATTLICQIFGGYLRSRVKCLNCKGVSDTFDPYLDIPLEIKTAQSVSKALEQFVKPEQLDGENAYKCSKCKKMVPASKRFSIHRSSNVLTLSLKRFANFSGGKITKATLKKYQTEHRSKVDSLERSQADLKKLKRKSQGGRNATKYDHKEAEYLQTISSRQSDIQRFIAEGCKEALLEEKRRFCFLADKHCNFAVHLNHYHVQAAELLNDKLSQWQDTCSDVTKVPDTVVGMMHEMKTPSTTPISGTPQPSPMMERNKLVDGDYDSISKSIPRMPPAPPNKAHTSPLVDMFNNPPTIQKNHPHERLKTADNPEEAGLPRSMSVSTGLNMMKRSKVKTIFPHNPGNNKTLLSFAEGDIITLLISEDKDGWLYGEHEITKSRGWFPSSYTRILTEPTQEPVHVPSPSTVRSISTVNLTDKSNVVLPPPDYLDQPSSKASTDSPRASINSTVGKATPPPLPSSTPQKPNANGTMKPPFLSGENPFATVKLRPTVTNDRSAPIIR